MLPLLIRVVRTTEPPLQGVLRIYIGRPSVLGNPWSSKASRIPGTLHVPSREEAIRLFEEDLDHQPQDSPAWQEIHRLAALQVPLELECWCAPKPCHGHVIAERIRRIRQAKSKG